MWGGACVCVGGGVSVTDTSNKRLIYNEFNLL